MRQYGVVIIGAGHAGCEAALACARMGVSTLLVTLDRTKSAVMSCNPSIGGVGKGQLVKEVDALGGEMGRVADWTGIHFKRLNTRKGSAVQSSRCQADKHRYAATMQRILGSQQNLEIWEGEARALVVRNGQVRGIELVGAGGSPEQVSTENVVVTAGTFLRAVMHCGDQVSEGGRFGERASVGLSDQLKDLGFRILRLKTGTPPRLRKGSLDFSRMEVQEPDPIPRRFSFTDTQIALPQICCYLGFTNEATHEVIRNNLARSPLYSGKIQGVGPRYCPSIEDKVVKFPEKPRHQIFFEPEALDSEWIYPNGISTSLPGDVQEAFLRTVPGCEGVEFLRHGYAVEYDCLDPRDLHKTLESRLLPGLFLAGQVNGTSGYEEAACQGLLAGINAALRYQGREPLVLDRSEAYLGVLVDDLTTQGVTEPYRMFTSRAEYRLSLREDNADLRLTERGRAVGLVKDAQWERFQRRRELLERYHGFLKGHILKPTEEIQAKLAAFGTSPLPYPQPLRQLLKRPELGIQEVMELSPWAAPGELDLETAETLEVETKYEGYIAIQNQELERMRKLTGLGIPRNFEYRSVIGLSEELKEKLAKRQPATVAEAARISGVTPAAISALLYSLQKRGGSPASASV